MTYLPVPDLYLVGSTNVYDEPGVVVGGIGSPFVEVTSRPFRPLGPTCSYWPDFGAIYPGLKPLFFDIACSSSTRTDLGFRVDSSPPIARKPGAVIF
jgi:hypothetical protein